VRSRAGRRARRGFVLIELLTALAVLAILGGIALPSLRAAVYRADAAKVVTDMTAVRQALFDYREDSNRLPRTSPWGRAPPELESYLEELPFRYKDLDYRVVVNRRRGRVDFYVRYPRGSHIGAALQRFRRPGSDSGSVIWSLRRTAFRLLEDNR
jgi:prepilin-type N-terminal cleavage/methylation domain-containing protein